ncbi:hypothetical protein AVEN_73811-1, partial [Araneus ventricosus]
NDYLQSDFQKPAFKTHLHEIGRSRIVIQSRTKEISSRKENILWIRLTKDERTDFRKRTLQTQTLQGSRNIGNLQGSQKYEPFQFFSQSLQNLRRFAHLLVSNFVLCRFKKSLGKWFTSVPELRKILDY